MKIQHTDDRIAKQKGPLDSYELDVKKIWKNQETIINKQKPKTIVIAK